MPNESSPSPAIDVSRVLAERSVRDAGARARFLAAVRELGKDAAPFGSDRLAQLMQVEEHFHTLLLYDQLAFLRGPEVPDEGERDFAHTVQRICLESANGFQRFLRNRDDWAGAADAADAAELRWRVTGLALHCIHGYVKWGCFLGEPGRSVPWKQLHALYFLAESEGYAQAPFVLHASLPAFRPSVQSLYLLALFLDLMNSGNLTRVQLELADGWFSSWCGDYSLDTQYSSRTHLLYVDLANDRGLHLMQSDSHGGMVRYVQADALRTQLEEVQASLRHGRLYAGSGSGAVFPIEEHVALLAIIERLYHSMSAGAENRIEERTRFEDREVEVVVGMERLLAKIRGGPTETAVPAAPSFTSEMVEISPSGLSLTAIEPDASAVPAIVDTDIVTWRVNDLSSKGYGLLVEKGSADAVMLNGIIGLRNQTTGLWIVGTVVRKLANRVRGEMLAGVEVICYRPVRVEIAPVQGGEPVEALFMPGTDASGKLDSIVVRTVDFSAATSYRIAACGRAYRIRLNRIVKKGPDWVRARYEIETGD